jgi:cold shock CspA family protein
MNDQSRLTRIGVFYDGNYFFRVSNYYNYSHSRRSRLSIDGLHAFIREQVAREEGVDPRYCQIVDAHYFRGRISAIEAQNRQKLLAERQWDDVLMRQGVVTHYLPLSGNREREGGGGEKGVDVWFALEAFELAIFKKFNVIVLIACDGDFIPLVRKLNTLGTRVMVLGWDFSYVDEMGVTRTTTTSIDLLDAVSYPVLMHSIIDDKTRRNDPLINNMFMPRREMDAMVTPSTGTPVMEGRRPVVTTPNGINGNGNGGGGPYAQTVPPGNGVIIDADPAQGRIQNLKDGYGFITPDNGGTNLFFFWADVADIDFNELRIGDRVEYILGMNEKGPIARQIYLMEE